MRPVDPQEIITLATERPALILHKDAMGFSYIDMLVHRSPNSVASKQKRTVFPLEIWEMVLNFGKEWMTQDYTHHILVQPEHILGDYLICKPIPDDVRVPCSDLENPWQIQVYEEFLNCPDGNGGPSTSNNGCGTFQVLIHGEVGEEEEDTSSSEEDFDGAVHQAPDDFETTESIRILIPTLSGDIKTLFADITVPDVIGWVETGDCSLCGEGRVFCVGCKDGTEVIETWFGYKPTWADCGKRMLCPLCLGEDYAYESVWRERFPEEEDEHDEEEEDEYSDGDDLDMPKEKEAPLDTWVFEREVALGHRGYSGYK